MTWTNSRGAYSRSVAMLGAVHETGRDLLGLKVINAAVSNPALGLDRAGGLAFLYDPDTARLRLMAEAGLLSALRTAARIESSSAGVSATNSRRPAAVTWRPP